MKKETNNVIDDKANFQLTEGSALVYYDNIDSKII